MFSRVTRFHQTTRTIVTAVVLGFIVSACGITAPRFNDGFANLDSPGMADTDRVISLSLGPAVLRLAARFVDDDPETQALLRSLDGVRVRIYEVHGDIERVNENFRDMGNRLDSDGWDPVMLVHEEDELVQMFAKSSAKGLRGLTILSAGGDEVVIVNIMGEINPDQYGDLMVALNVEGAPEAEVAVIN